MSKVWTGERLETFIFNQTTVEHLHRYSLAYGICKNLDVLDIASGEGYGSNLLSLTANNVTGVDISKEAVEAAAKKYQKSNLTFKEGSASQIPVDTNSIDIVVSFETIEHHDKHTEMMNEIIRVLKPNGILIMSSPDKKYYSDVPGYANPFHVKELYFEEFKTLINSSFKHVNFFSQKIVAGSLMIPEKAFTGFCHYEGDYDNIQINTDFAPLYNLCVASNTALPDILPSLFNGQKVNDYAAALAVDNAVKNAVNEVEARVKGTWSYKVGHFFLFPFKLFKKT